MPPTVQQIIGHFEPAQAKDLLRRGLKVQAKARRLVGGAEGHIKRVNTGDLRSSIGVKLIEVAGKPAVRIGTGKKYAHWVHDGTGVYGPHRTRIVPKTAKALVFASKTYGAKKGKFKGKVVVRSVRGMQKNEFLKDALPAAHD